MAEIPSSFRDFFSWPNKMSEISGLFLQTNAKPHYIVEKTTNGSPLLTLLTISSKVSLE